MKITFGTLGTLMCIACLTSCSRTQTTTNFEDTEVIDSVAPANNDAATDDLNKSKTIFYTLPAPIEMASIIKETGVRFDEQLLAQLSKSAKFSTNMKMALNLGIYATDMSVAGMFNQSQRMVDYLATLKTLTQKLGIVKIMDEDLLSRLERSDLSRQEALNTISEVYMTTNQYLTENNRRNVATMVMAGAWVEGLYLALNLVNPDKLNPDIVGRLVAQKLSMATMLTIIDGMNPNNSDEDLNYIRAKMEQISTIFDAVELQKSGRVSAITDADTRTTTIQANKPGTLDKDVLLALKDVVSQVRNDFAE